MHPDTQPDRYVDHISNPTGTASSRSMAMIPVLAISVSFPAPTYPDE
jgi:hypothetical protein